MGYHGVRKKDVKEDLFGTGTTEAYQNIASGFYPHLSRIYPSYSNEGQMQSSGLGVDSFGGLSKSNHDIQPPYYKCIPSTLGTKKGQLDNVPPNQDNIPLLTTQILCPSGSDKCEIYKDTEQQRARPQVERHYRESSQQNPRVSRIPE